MARSDSSRLIEACMRKTRVSPALLIRFAADPIRSSPVCGGNSLRRGRRLRAAATAFQMKRLAVSGCCKKIKVTLVIAKLDRLSRDVHFITDLGQEQRDAHHDL